MGSQNFLRMRGSELICLMAALLPKIFMRLELNWIVDSYLEKFSLLKKSLYILICLLKTYELLRHAMPSKNSVLNTIQRNKLGASKQQQQQKTYKKTKSS